jgi:hypothetical protein
MGTEELGIDKVQGAVDIIVEVVLETIAAVKDEDGLTLTEGISIALSAVPEFADVWKTKDELVAQLKDLSLEELIQLINGVIEQLQLGNEKLEAVIKKGLLLVVAGADFGLAVKDLKAIE